MSGRPELDGGSRKRRFSAGVEEGNEVVGDDWERPRLDYLTRRHRTSGRFWRLPQIVDRWPETTERQRGGPGGSLPFKLNFSVPVFSASWERGKNGGGAREKEEERLGFEGLP
jgi:hypothetical protein